MSIYIVKLYRQISYTLARHGISSMTKRSQLVPIVGTGAAAAMIFNILPFFVGRAAEAFGLSDGAAGWLATTYLAGFGVSSVSAPLWLHRLGKRALGRLLFLSAAVLLAAGGMIASYVAVLGVLLAVGLLLGGLYTMSFLLAAEHPDATRALGVKLGGEVALGALLLALLPTLIYPAFGFSGILGALAIVLVSVSACTHFLAKHALETGNASMDRGHFAMPASAGLALGALFLFTVGQASVWSFVERAGARAEFDASAIGGVLSVAVLFGGVGSFLAGALSDRLGKAMPLAGAASLYLVAMALFAFGGQFWFYAGAVNLFFFSWLFALPYLISAIAGLDDSGRATSLVTASLAFGSMLGPAAGGELLERGGFLLLYFSGSLVTAAAYAVVLGMAVRQRLVSRRSE